MVAALVAAFVSYALLIRKPPDVLGDALAPFHPRFNAARAAADLRALLETCPERVTGSPGGRCAARFIEDRFREAGLPTRRQIFPLWLRGKRVEGTNVLARIRGTSSRTLVLLAHYDAPTTSRDAASDNATGVATLLELARVLSQEKQARTLIFAATDAGVWGSLGADTFARERSWEAFTGAESAAPYAAISLDHLTPGPARGIALRGGGQFGGFAPIWLRARVAYAIASSGVRVFPERAFRQILSRAVPIPFQDQGALLRRGIPTINLEARSEFEETSRRVAFTDEDRMENIQPGALLMFGRMAEVAARAVLTAGVTRSPDVITLTPEKIIARKTVRWMTALLFLPLAALALAGRRWTWSAFPSAARATARASAWALPVVLAALALRLAVRLALLPRFSLYPATLRDPFLTAWAPLPMAAALAAALLGGIAAARLAGRSGRALRGAGLGLLLAAVLWTWVRNDLAAAVFLTPAAWAWPWIGVSGERRARWLDAMLLLVGLAPLAALLWFAGERLFLGPWILWYGALLEAYGVLSLHAACAAGLALAAAVALLRSGPAGD